ncbi:MAG: hypothetical protein AAF571_13805 [Verrucomicrobiota bacterium]
MKRKKLFVLFILFCLTISFHQIGIANTGLSHRIEQLEKQITALPDASKRQQQKKMVLHLAVERAKNAIEADSEAVADILIKESVEYLQQDITDRPAPNLSSSLHMELKTKENNPYLDALYTWAEQRLAQSDIPFKKATADVNPFTGLHGNYGTREEAANMNHYYWLAAHPESRYLGHPKLVTHLFRRIHAYVDAHQLHGHDYRDRTNDFFAIGPMVEAMHKTVQTFPDLLLPSDQQNWEKLVRQIYDFWLNEYRKTENMGFYANRDLAVANILLCSGMYLEEPEGLDVARKLVMAQFDNLYPDGGIAYIGTQNESCGYHGANTTFLTRYYHLSGQTEALDLLKKTEWYAPISVEPGNVSDFWTCSSWKHAWNTGVGFGGESVVGLTGNPYERTMLDSEIAKSGASLDPLSAMWYRNDIETEPFPDHYTIFDRNISGPRGRFGRFSYAANLRIPNNKEPGSATIMGAMTTESDIDKYPYPLEAVLSGIMPKVMVETTPNEKHKRPKWVYLTSGANNAASVGRDWSAMHSHYQLHAYGSSRKGAVAPWNGTQLWLGIGNRLFGLLEVSPQGEQEAFEVAMAATLGVGGVGEHRKKPLATHSDQHWSLGTLHFELLGHNFDSVRVNEIKMRRAPAYEIFCSTRPASEPASADSGIETSLGTLGNFSQQKPYYAVVEVSHAQDSKAAAQIKTIQLDTLTGLSIQLASESYTLLFNHGDEAREVDGVKLGLSDIGMLHYPRGHESPPTPLADISLVIPAGEHRVILSGIPTEEMKQSGWDTFEKMAQELTPVAATP